VTGLGAAQEHAVQSVTYPDGTHTYYEYDPKGRVNRVSKDGPAESVTFTYDSDGRVTASDALGNAWVKNPNDLGSLSILQDPLKNLTSTFFDQEGKTIKRIGADDSVTSINYDANGNVSEMWDPLANRVSTVFASNGDLHNLTDALGNTTSNSYDKNFNLAAITYPDTRQEQASYDSRGNLTSWTNRRGQTINYTYDDKNLLTQKTHSNGVIETYSYDGHRNLQTATGPWGAINFIYDSADRITRVTYPNGTYLRYWYDSGGRRSGMQDQTGFTVNYGYDAVGRLSLITSGSGALIASYVYDAVGRLSQKNLGNGAYSTYSYDNAGNLLHLVNYSGGVINSRFDYTYDAAGRRISMSTNLLGLWQYGYNANGQLTSVTLPTGAKVTYTYDAAGNRSTTVTGGSTVDYYVNNLNQYTWASGTAFQYDDDGNLTSQTNGAQSWNYVYDDQNRLISLRGPQGVFDFAYDSLGNRYAQSANGKMTSYLVDPTGLPSVIASVDSSGTTVNHFAYGLGLETISNSPSSFAYYQFDGSSNTAIVSMAVGRCSTRICICPSGRRSRIQKSCRIHSPTLDSSESWMPVTDFTPCAPDSTTARPAGSSTRTRSGWAEG
jgi:YD repeat-containing protein